MLSLVLLLLSVLLPPAVDSEDFGTGSMRAKQRILGATLFCLLFIVGFKTGTGWSDARPASDPAWWESKPAYYVILYGFEITVLYLFLAARIDKRFWVPNGSDGPGDYSKAAVESIDLGGEVRKVAEDGDASDAGERREVGTRGTADSSAEILKC